MALSGASMTSVDTFDDDASMFDGWGIGRGDVEVGLSRLCGGDSTGDRPGEGLGDLRVGAVGAVVGADKSCMNRPLLTFGLAIDDWSIYRNNRILYLIDSTYTQISRANEIDRVSE